MREGLKHWPMSLEMGGKNLLKAWRAGVSLVTGSDAGNFFVLHGPTVQHEIELWVAAGIPVEVALQAATSNAAKLLRADSRIGTVEKGKEATLVDRGREPAPGRPRPLSGLRRVHERGAGKPDRSPSRKVIRPFAPRERGSRKTKRRPGFAGSPFRNCSEILRSLLRSSRAPFCTRS